LDTLPNEGKESRGIDAKDFRNVPCVSICVWGTWWRPQAGKTHTRPVKKGPLDTLHHLATPPRRILALLLLACFPMAMPSLLQALWLRLATQPTDTHAPPIHFYPQEDPNHDGCHSRPKKKTHRRCPHCCCCHLPFVGQWGHGLYRACVLAFSQHLVLIPAAKLCGRDDDGPPGGW
jgi:hypothetical protein